MKPLTKQWHETNKAHGEQYLPWLEARAEEMRLRIMVLEGENRRLGGVKGCVELEEFTGEKL